MKAETAVQEDGEAEAAAEVIDRIPMEDFMEGRLTGTSGRAFIGLGSITMSSILVLAVRPTSLQLLLCLQ